MWNFRSVHGHEALQVCYTRTLSWSGLVNGQEDTHDPAAEAEEVMNCPNCDKTSETLAVIVEAHLGGGDVWRWCPRCGAAWRCIGFSEKILELKVPWVSKLDEDK